ncbi:unnamed protein product [Ceutorhynchus assimilis]|uniref:SHSP domain-containing protein n=1 Tax=Ceutorhynchus assimilis TaxID=467358 RepID=A0A9N9QPE1_9CUCU|nr:unnamed protein product [Ceutorhynchus assimilis]
MALLPLLLEETFPLPRRDYLSIFAPEEDSLRLRNAINQLVNLEKDTSITVDKDQFQANIDVQQFTPEEITVKLEDENSVTVEGKHEEKQDEHGYISRHFVRKYVLPEDCDVKKLQSKLSSDGVLSISAPKRRKITKQKYREIPIVRTGPLRKLGAGKHNKNNV